MPETWVFAYGSLMAVDVMEGLLGRTPRPGTDFAPGWLRGWRRTWEVCTDNTDPARKVTYLSPEAEHVRPRVQVLFLDASPSPGSRLDGMLLRVDPATLRRMDARERNYDRIDISEDVEDVGPEDKVWTYVGRKEQAARARAGIVAGSARIERGYFDRVRRACAERSGRAGTESLPPAPEGVEIVVLDRVRHAVRPEASDLPLAPREIS
ncbi:gamma-glutamylcyclotransferase family protein [Actinocorallia longicatena]|uniref:Gamma-glutamylcyclotransferase AIG2-like domain-containing protein n=1 Tax=Actinocorallia longicatena TaxID=111803 RepID=A0ABP6QCU8_9ACTN